MMDSIFKLLVSFLSGSLVSGIVTILIQRNHKKKDEQRDLYKNLRSRLCHYKDDICNVLISFYKNTHQHCDLIDRNTDELDKKMHEVNQQMNLLKIQYKECTLCEVGKTGKCSHLVDSMNKLMDEIDKKTKAIKKEQEGIKQEAYNFENDYWQDNEEIYNIIDKHKNLASDLGIIKNKSILLINLNDYPYIVR